MDCESKMKNESESEIRTVVESRGNWCPPTPLMDLTKAWRTAKVGDVIELRATEPDIEKDVRAWAKKSGNSVVGVTKEKNYTRLVVRIGRVVRRRGMGVKGMPAVKTNVNIPDQTKVTPKAKLQLFIMGGFPFGLRTLEPGWRWTTSMKPIMKTDTCEVRHVGYVISGAMGFSMSDGKKLDVGPGDAFDVPPGHDAWTVGEAPVVFIDLIGAAEHATATESAT
jgi:TusA-related sulfurtransferase